MLGYTQFPGWADEVKDEMRNLRFSKAWLGSTRTRSVSEPPTNTRIAAKNACDKGEILFPFQCLTLLATEDIAARPAAGQLTQPVEEILNVLRSLIVLPGLSVAIGRQQQRQHHQLHSHASDALEGGATATRGMDFLDLILGAILIEDEIEPLVAYILFIGQLTQFESFVVTCLPIAAISKPLALG